MARRRRDRIPINAEINVVSLIDVMMLLLVIFMITAPMMQGGVDVTLPRAQGRPLEQRSGLVITIDRAGNIFVDQTKMNLAEFRGSFKGLADQRVKQGVYLRADASVPYEKVVQVLSVMIAAGVTGVGLTVEPIRER